MSQLICFFFSPCISVFILEQYQKEANWTLKKYATVYAVFVGIVNMLCLGIVGVIFRNPENLVEPNMFNISFFCKYIIFSCIISLLLPATYIILVKRWSEDKDEKYSRDLKRDLLPAFILSFITCFMLFVYEPVLMYVTNINEFWFDFWTMMPPTLIVFITVMMGIMLFYVSIYLLNIILFHNTILYKILVIIGFIFLFLLYIQGNWLIGKLPGLTGEKIIWENYGKIENLVVLIVGFFIYFMLLVLLNKDSINRTLKFNTVLSCMICSALVISLVTTMVIQNSSQENVFKRKDNFIATFDNFNTISSGNNFLIFLVDTVDENTFSDILISDIKYQDIFEDFTIYTDVMSKYPFTMYSIPQILTGKTCKNEMTFSEFSSLAYNNSPLLKKLSLNGYDINIYSQSIVWDGEKDTIINNAMPDYKSLKLHIDEFAKQEIKYICYKYLPYNLKRFSGVETLDFEQCIEKPQKTVYNMMNHIVYREIKDNWLLEKSDKNQFQFIHVEGAHPPFNMDETLIIGTGGTYRDEVKASLTMVEAYIQRLKDNNCYDNSVIVIMSDHGFQSDGEDENDVRYRFDPILLIKGIDEKHWLIKSDLPISHTDLQDAFCKLIDGEKTLDLFTNVKKDRRREILSYGWPSNDHLVEYETYGKAHEVDKFSPTGNVYDLQK